MDAARVANARDGEAKPAGGQRVRQLVRQPGADEPQRGDHPVEFAHGRGGGRDTLGRDARHSGRGSRRLGVASSSSGQDTEHGPDGQDSAPQPGQPGKPRAVGRIMQRRHAARRVTRESSPTPRRPTRERTPAARMRNLRPGAGGAGSRDPDPIPCSACATSSRDASDECGPTGRPRGHMCSIT
jgi:hypothetical protein